MPSAKDRPQGAKPGQYSTPVEADLKKKKILDPAALTAGAGPDNEGSPMGLLLALTYES